MSAAQNYASYLQLDRLLNAQKPKFKGPEYDKTLFIIIHQVYERWFIQLLHKLDFIPTELLAKSELSKALDTFRLSLSILKTVVSQIDILETITPVVFNRFSSVS